jgi:hypothetical protein
MDRVSAAGISPAQTEVGANTNEIPMIIPLPDGLDLDQAPGVLCGKAIS